MLFAADPQAAAFMESLIGLACAAFLGLFVFIFGILVIQRLGNIIDRLDDIESSVRFLRRLRYNQDTGKFELPE